MINSENLWKELKLAQLSLVGINDINSEIIYTWEHIPEKLTPGHRQRGKNRIDIYCLPFKIKHNGEFIFSHWKNGEFINTIPRRSKELDSYLLEIASFFLKKKRNLGHVKENNMDVLHDSILFLYTKCCCVNLNKVENAVPVFLFWLNNRFNSTTKWYFPTGNKSIEELRNID